MTPERLAPSNAASGSAPLREAARTEFDAVPVLRMLQMKLSSHGLLQLGRRRRLPLRDVDEGYLVHCALGELFGDLRPTLFSVRSGRGRYLEVLAYAPHGVGELREHAEAYAEPRVYSVCDWNTLSEKSMPTSWREGMLLGFETRVCPVVRTANDRAKRKAGAEVDAYLAAVEGLAGADAPSRADVYSEWLRRQCDESRSGAEILRLEMVAFRLTRLVRRTHDEQRRSRVQERPDVAMRGVLAVRNARSFNAFLRRGIGRHRAFGFGMLLLRPAS